MSRDLRKYARQTTCRLIIGGLFVLVVIGVGLIYFIYGSGPAFFGLLCILVGLVPIVVIVIFLWVLEWIRKRSE